jgi:hypothetical protein
MMNLRIDTVLLDNQPSSYFDEPVQATVTRGIDGSYVAQRVSKGRRLHVTWGIDVAVTAVLEELRAARGGVEEHVIAWENEDGDPQVMNALWPGDPAYEMVVSGLIRNFTITFFEA